MGGRRRANTFDEDKYYNTVFAALIERSRNDVKPDLADKLAQAQQSLTGAAGTAP